MTAVKEGVSAEENERSSTKEQAATPYSSNASYFSLDSVEGFKRLNSLGGLIMPPPSPRSGGSPEYPCQIQSSRAITGSAELGPRVYSNFARNHLSLVS